VAAGFGGGSTIYGDTCPRRPLRLTRRGRIVRMAALILLAWGVMGLLATASRAADPAATLPVVVVQPGDTLWSVAERHRPSRDPFGVIESIRQLNELDGYTVHAGQELRLPRAG